MARTEAALVAALLRSDFHSFLRKCFETLHPGTPFQDNWHLRVLSGELERLGRGETTRLIINLPPRSLKSIATSVAFVAWTLGHQPSAGVICASYGADLAEKLAFDCRKIMTSRWYEAVFATRVDRRKSARRRFLHGAGRRAPGDLGRWLADRTRWRSRRHRRSGQAGRNAFGRAARSGQPLVQEHALQPPQRQGQSAPS